MSEINSLFAFVFSLRPFLSLAQICAFASDPEKTSEALPPLTLEERVASTAFSVIRWRSLKGRVREYLAGKGDSLNVDEPMELSAALLELPRLAYIQELDFDLLRCHYDAAGEKDDKGRYTFSPALRQMLSVRNRLTCTKLV